MHVDLALVAESPSETQLGKVYTRNESCKPFGKGVDRRYSLLFTPTPAIRFFIQSAENEKIFIHSALVFRGVKC